MRLIDADKLEEKLRKEFEWMEETFGNGDFQRGCKTATSVILHLVQNTFTCKIVDAKPVMNGHWSETHLITLDKNKKRVERKRKANEM